MWSSPCAFAGPAQVPTWATNNLWPETDGMGSGLKSFVDSVIIILSTGYTIGCLSAIGCAPVRSACTKPTLRRAVRLPRRRCRCVAHHPDRAMGGLSARGRNISSRVSAAVELCAS